MKDVKTERIELPNRMIPSKGELEQLGFVFIEDDNSSFRCIAIPDGWELREGIFNLFDIVDQNGMKRGGITECIFSSYMYLDRRYDVKSKEIVDTDKVEVYFGDDTEKLFVAGEFTRFGKKSYEEEENLITKAIEFANENYPDWEKVDSYWDRPKKVDLEQSKRERIISIAAKLLIANNDQRLISDMTGLSMDEIHDLDVAVGTYRMRHHDPLFLLDNKSDVGFAKSLKR